MRQFFLITCLFAVTVSLAQKKMPEYYQSQKEAPVQNYKNEACYVRKFDAGTSAFRRGDYRAALRLFEEAKSCPDAISNFRRTKDLDSKIDDCNSKLSKNVAADGKNTQNRRTSGIEITGRKFHRSAAFSRNTDPNCFRLTEKEANRAFRDSCWDDAAKLYRAAKTCADANQTDRERMNVRIEACRSAAEDELLQKEQQAVRTARHALASGLSDDVLALLRQGDRSAAWRLGDFANFYIAPDDNPDCLDAMYAAYYYEQSEAETVSLSPAFCYQFPEFSGDNVQFKFVTIKSKPRLVVFIPGEHRMLYVDIPSLKSYESFIEPLKDPKGFETDPNGELMFYGTDYFQLPNDIRLVVPSVANFCFSDNGRLFLYEDPTTTTINIVNLDQSFRVQQQRNDKYDKIGRTNLRPDAFPIAEGLLAMAVHQEDLWLGYRDRVELRDLNNAKGAISPKKIWHFADSSLLSWDSPFMRLYPESGMLIIANQFESHYFSLKKDLTDDNVLPLSKIKGQLLDCTARSNSILMVSTEIKVGSWEEIITVRELAATPKILNRFYNKSGGITQIAAISPDGRWLAGQDINGKTNLWSLQDSSINQPVPFESQGNDQFSPDGNRLYSMDHNQLKVYDVDDVESGAEHVFETIPGAVLPVGNANKWVVFLNTALEISIENLITKQQFNYPLNSMAGNIPYTFDYTETRYFAYSPGSGLVQVINLNDGPAIEPRDFGGVVTQLKSIPGTDKVLVVTKSLNDRYTVKVWDFSKPTEKPQIVRLQDYDVQFARVSEQGDRIALSNTRDIRLFLLDNLNDEAVVIKPEQNNVIRDMAFRPDGLALVSGDNDGNITIWDITNGHSLLRFSNISAGEKHPVNHLAFAYNGTRLRIISPKWLLAANLDPYTLRDAIQSGDRWLRPFSSQQIRSYDLEIAFQYPGNIERLAQSGDVPLIRSFFHYFREQSISSNNIYQVRNYCDRAYYLFESLDANAQRDHESTMLEMYEDYILKLLLRNMPQVASGVVRYIEKHFKQSEISLLTAAHTALMQRNLKVASQLYTNYLLMISSSGTELFDRKLEETNTKLSQFKEYDLLDSTQIGCVCNLFHQFETFEKLCPPGVKYNTSPYSDQVFIYRKIYRTIDSAAYLVGKNARVQLLERTLALATSLDAGDAYTKVHPRDTIVIALADAYLEQAEAEQNASKTPVIYEKTIKLLENSGPFKTHSDTARLAFLLRTHLAWGKYLMELDKPAEASLQLNASLQAAELLTAALGQGTAKEEAAWAQDISPVYMELSRAKLLEGKPAEAKEAYKRAAAFQATIPNAMLLEYAALLENNNNREAILDPGAIATAADLGAVLYQIDQMADLLPAHRERLKISALRLKRAVLQEHPEIVEAEADFTRATFQINRYAAQSKWDTVLAWSNKANSSLEKLLNAQDNAEIWRHSWLSQQIGQAFFLLCAKHNDTSALTSIIRLSTEVLDKIESEDPYSELKTFVFTNMAHAFYLRNRPGDREKAIETYSAHLSISSYDYDPWELLQKDFRDLHQAGVQWPDLRNLVQRIKPPGIELTPEDWAEMGE